MINDQEILAAALVGYQSQLSQIEAKIAEIKSQLGGAPAAVAAVAAPVVAAPAAAPAKRAYKKKAAPEAKQGRKKRVLSPEARANMAAGQRRRWEQYAKAQGK